MTTEQRDKYAYELMVKNNPDEAVKQLLLKDKVIEKTQQRIDKAIDYVEKSDWYLPLWECNDKQPNKEDLLKILKGEE